MAWQGIICRSSSASCVRRFSQGLCCGTFVSGLKGNENLLLLPLPWCTFLNSHFACVALVPFHKLHISLHLQQATCNSYSSSCSSSGNSLGVYVCNISTCTRALSISLSLSFFHPLFTLEPSSLGYICYSFLHVWLSYFLISCTYTSGNCRLVSQSHMLKPLVYRPLFHHRHSCCLRHGS